MSATRYLYLARHAHADPASGSLTPQGREQAVLLADRLRARTPERLRHGPLPRAAQTARLVADHLTGLEPEPAAEAGDYAPSIPTRDEVPPEYAEAVTGFVQALPADERDGGPDLARRALASFTGAVGTGQERHDLVITHAFLVGFLVGAALHSPRWRWVSLAPGHASLTVIRYPPDAPPSVLVYNDMSHLPEELRWSGFPPHLRL